jgi:ParB family chromosome partitioning protein
MRALHRSRRLLNFLSDNGYRLSDIERVIVGEHTADDLFTRMSRTADPGDDK